VLRIYKLHSAKVICEHVSHFVFCVLMHDTVLNEHTVYLGAYNEEEAAARAYDLAALKYWGPSTYTNFPVCLLISNTHAV
jgi:hypothetical protein